MESPESDWRSVELLRSPMLANEWALVLSAADIPWRLEERAGAWELRVPVAEVERASRALAGYAAERARARAAAALSTHRGGIAAGVGAGLGLLVFFFCLRLGLLPDAEWSARGSGHSGRIVAGEWWRVVTSLTLHAHLAHVAGNAAGIAVFGGAICRWFGPGLGLFMVLAAGALGNALNAFFRGGGHAVVGASTAVFAAVGMLSALQLTRRFALPASGLMRIRHWAPLAGGLALLGLLGTSETSDIGAHLFGFAAGMAIGWIASAAHLERAGAGVQAALVAASAATVLGCWGLALR